MELTIVFTSLFEELFHVRFINEESALYWSIGMEDLKCAWHNKMCQKELKTAQASFYSFAKTNFLLPLIFKISCLTTDILNKNPITNISA